ncbi:MAG: 4-hydroxybenzoate polyprenyltransferase [Natronomonas sp.]|jgi:4-hydroxybenzoate polyprenyltransferase
MTSPRMLARVVFETSRPAQLALVVGVYLFGAKIALAGGATLSWSALLAGCCALLPLAASTHYANEYADYETDALTERTPFSGGAGRYTGPASRGPSRSPRPSARSPTACREQNSSRKGDRT